MSTSSEFANNAAVGGGSGGTRVIAVGRAGLEMALALRDSGVPGFTYAAVDADGTAGSPCPLPEMVCLGARLTRGFGAGGDPELAKAAAEDEIQSLRGLCQGQGMVFLLAGLGGGSGTGITPVLARLAREAGASVFAFVTSPFECEGSRRQQQALVGLHRLKTVADGVLCLPNEKMLDVAGEAPTLLDAYRASREHIRDAVLCVWNQLTRPGVMNVHFADICSVLRGPNLESAFARVEAEGPDRADAALQLLLSHPLLAAGETLRRAEALLVCFTAGPDLGMQETRRVVAELNRLSGGARVVVGASVDELCGGRLTLTVIASTRQVVLHESAEDPLPATTSGASRAPELTAEASDRRPSRRFAPPPPELTPELAGELLGQAQGSGKPRGSRRKPQQVQLPFEVITRGRFEKCEPTLRGGHNLDQPTYLRRGVALN